MLNPQIQGLGPYASKAIARSVEGSMDVANLSIGEPEFGPPPAAAARLEEVVRATTFIRAAKRYEESRGLPSLRALISGYYRHYSGLAVSAQTEVLVTAGGAGALTAAILATTRPGDAVLIGDPSYMLYERLVTVLGRVPRRLVRKASEGFRYDLDRVRAAIDPSTTAMIVNSPENPTGYVCPDAEMAALLELCRSRGMTLIHDEVYDQLCFDRPHRPAASFGGLANVVQINSMSKKFGVPGLRLGWLVSSEETVGVAAKAQDYTTLAVGRFAERAGEVLLECPGLDEWFAEVRASMKKRLELVASRLSAIPGIELPSPISGGMFAFPTVAALAHRLGLRSASGSGAAVTEWLLARAKVAVVPGGVYGRQGEDSVRLVVCGGREDLHRALARIEGAAAPTSTEARRD